MSGAALLRLMTWLSPAFPVGAFSYSHGLETAIAGGLVRDADTLHDWLDALLEFGGAWTDAVLLAGAHRGEEVADLAEALCISKERHAETMGQGVAFLQAAEAWDAGSLPAASAPLAYPVAVGQVCARAGIPLEDALVAYLHAFTSNLVSVALRAAPLGQTAGVTVLARLEHKLLETAARANRSGTNDLGSAALRSDLCALNHETLKPRLFIS